MHTSTRWITPGAIALCAVTSLALLLAPAPSLAQGQQEPSPAASATPEPSPTPAANADPNNGVFGDFGGARSALARRGVTFFGRYAGEFAGNVTGSPQGTAYASEVQLGANVDFGLLNGIRNGGTLHFIATQRFGSGLSSNVIGNIGSVQEIFGDGMTTRLTELDYEQPLGSDAFNVKFGRVIMQSDFAAGSTYWNSNLWCEYQSNAICGTPVGVPNNSGYGFYPSSEWGVRFKAQSPSGFYVKTGAYQVNPTYSQRGHGFNLSITGDTGTDFPFETGMAFRDHDGTNVGNLRLGGYYDTSNVLGAESALSRFVDPTNPALGAIPQQTYRGRDGFYVLTDHLIQGSALPGRAGTAFFLAYEFGDPQTAVISSFLDAGVVRHGTFAGRPNDTIALGFAYMDVNARLRNFEMALQNAGYAVPLNGQEKVVELNYGLQLTKSIVLRPGLQYVINPAGEQNVVYPGGAIGKKNTLVLGLGTNINF
jgi:porin